MIAALHRAAGDASGSIPGEELTIATRSASPELQFRQSYCLTQSLIKDSVFILMVCRRGSAEKRQG
jgi:hypothetical protein